MSIIHLKNAELLYADMLGSAYCILQGYYHNNNLTYSRGYKWLLSMGIDMSENVIVNNRTKVVRSRIFESFVR